MFRRPRTIGRTALPLVPLAIVLLGTLSLGGAALVSAGPPPAGIRYSAEEARRLGLSDDLQRRAIGARTIVELLPGSAVSGSRARGAAPDRGAVLAVTEDGSSLAYVSEPDDPGAGLTIVHIDGSVVTIGLQGPMGAAFAPDAGWLATVDAAGRLWRVDPGSGTVAALADGPFVGVPLFLDDGSLLLTAVPSAEAPYAAWLTRLDPASGAELPEPTIGAPLVLGVRRLNDGDLAVTVHRAGGSVVVQRGSGGAFSPLAELPSDAVDVAVSPDGASVAYVLAGSGVFLHDAARGTGTRLGEGSLPQFSPDGAALLVQREAGAVVLGVDGALLATLQSRLAAWVTCEGRCPR
jgi:dipeptidyl aminopeptidase/acylaminoacyl peptidase